MPAFPIVLPVTLSAKKGDAQAFHLGIHEVVPFPSIGSDWTHPWQGLATLDPSTYRNSQGVRLPGTYSASLLWRGEGLAHNNTDVCGWKESQAPTGLPRQLPVVRPSPVFRGQPCGEVGLTFDGERNRTGKANGWTRPEVIVSGALTTAAREWLHDSLAPVFLEAIEKHKAELRAHALAHLREAFREGVARLRADADKREAEAADILAKIGG